MVARCQVDKSASSDGFWLAKAEGTATIEFRDAPTFFVARTPSKWAASQGRVNGLYLLGATSMGLLFHADLGPGGDPASVPRRTSFVPWSNIVSFSQPAFED